MKHFPRAFEAILQKRLREHSRLVQMVIGPRQVGKTSGVIRTLEAGYSPEDYAYHECEEAIHDTTWFQSQVQKAEEEDRKIIVFDEIQKIEDWGELVKLSWDRQKRKKKQMQWILLGSGSLQLTQGATDSMAGRFETIPVNHWGFRESREAFGLTLRQYIDYGGYPGSYPLLTEPIRFRKYLLDSIFESVVTRDILRFASVKKPSLFRQTFILACQYPAKEVSYNKLLGQLQEAGNVDQVKHYLELFSQAFLMRLIFKHKHSQRRTSSPKLLISAPVFTRLFLDRSLTEEEIGSVFECMVGNQLCAHYESVEYWREHNQEVDFVIRDQGNLVGVEVKSKARKSSGLSAFKKTIPRSTSCIIDMDNYAKFEIDPQSFIETFAR